MEWLTRFNADGVFIVTIIVLCPKRGTKNICITNNLRNVAKRFQFELNTSWKPMAGIVWLYMLIYRILSSTWILWTDKSKIVKVNHCKCQQPTNWSFWTCVICVDSDARANQHTWTRLLNQAVANLDSCIENKIHKITGVFPIFRPKHQE